jgi:flagellar assembly protein FliH
MSDKRAGAPSKVTPARRVGEAKRVPLGNLAAADNQAQTRERRMDPQSREAFEKGLQTGLAKGRKEGFEAARTQLEQEQRETALEAGGFAAQRIESAVASLNSDLATLEDMLADQVVDLAVSLARQIVMGELAQHPEQIRHVVGECLAMLPEETGKVRVRLNPADLNWIEQAIQARQLPPIDFLAVDEAIQPGGCTVEYAGGDVDATLATRWHRTLASIGKEAVDDADD